LATINVITNFDFISQLLRCIIVIYTGHKRQHVTNCSIHTVFMYISIKVWSVPLVLLVNCKWNAYRVMYWSWFLHLRTIWK